VRLVGRHVAGRYRGGVMSADTAMRTAVSRRTAWSTARRRKSPGISGSSWAGWP